MSAQGKRTTFDELNAAAQGGSLTVAEVFLAMRERQITEDQGRALLGDIQLRSSPKWHKIFVP
jgi:hypothetical protein